MTTKETRSATSAESRYTGSAQGRALELKQGDPTDEVASSVEPPMSPGLRTLLAKDPDTYWTMPDGMAPDDLPARPEPVAVTPWPARTTTVVAQPLSEGARTLLAKPPEYWTDTAYS